MQRFVSMSLKYLVRLFLLAIFTLTGLSIFQIWQRIQLNYLPSCQSNLKQIALGMFMYSQDYDELPPAIISGQTVGWAMALQPYNHSYSIFQCRNQWHSFSEAPQPDQPEFTDYWMNSNLSGIKDEKLHNPNQIILLGDGDGNSPASTASYAINRLPLLWLTSSDSPSKRHLDGANYAFVDGHVEWLKPNQVSQLPTSKKHPIFTFSNK